MKKIELFVENCGNCPFRLDVKESTGVVSYCRPSFGYENILTAMNIKYKDENFPIIKNIDDIPEWCPIDEREET